jgi:hypothetical protein
MMYNDRLSSEEANERIQQRMKEVQTYSLHKRLGYGDHAAAKWIFALIILLAVVAIGLL